MNGGVQLYETQALRQVTGETIRPGGMVLTERAFKLCSLPEGARVLDIACGPGASVQWMRTGRGFLSVGMDVSFKMLSEGRQGDPELPLAQGDNLHLPLDGEQFDAVLTECSLSLMPNLPRSLQEIGRILRRAGLLIASDLYLRSGQDVDMLRRMSIGNCLKGAKSKEELSEQIQTHGFDILYWEDHSDQLKALTRQLIQAHGSIQGFWCESGACDIDLFELQYAIARSRPGYYLMIARKR